MRLRALFIAASFLVFATGCGGGGASSALPTTASPGKPPTNSQAISATAKLLIPNAVTSNGKAPHFVSASTNGVQVVTYAHSDTNHATPLATVVTDVSSGSSACSSGAGGRTCNVNLQGPTGSDDFVFTLYDAAPVSGAIPGTAHLLGTAGITQTLTANMANVVTATIGGVITGLSGQPAFMSVPADGSTHPIGITINATDFGNNAITGTNGNYANPVTVAITEHGGNGHANVQLNGGTGAASVQAAKSSDTVQVSYDGKGSPGYYITVALSAATVSGQGGATENATISPLIVSSTSADYTQASSSVGLHGNGDLAPFTVTEAQAASPTFTFTRGTHCPAVALLETLSTTTFNVLALGNSSTYSSSTGCAMTVSDGTSTIVLGVSNTYTGTFSAPTMTEFPIATSGSLPKGITVGADGNLWFAECSGNKIAKIPTNATPGSSAQITEYPLPMTHGTPYPEGVSVGPDGNVWWADCGGGSSTIGKITTAGARTTYTTNSTNSYPKYIVAGPDGNMWFSECGSPYDVGKSTLSGSVTYYTPTTANNNYQITEGPDGNLWMAEISANKIARITTSGTFQEFPLAGGSGPFGIVAGPDGNLWFTESTSSKIGRITPSGSISEYATLTPAAGPQGITVGADGALWFAETNRGNIGRITTAGTVTEYATPTVGSGPYDITSGPDGALWFTENCVNQVGRSTI